MTGRGARRFAESAALVARDLARNRVAIALLLVIPTVFYLLIDLTTGDRDILFQLVATGSRMLVANERLISLLFIGMAAVSGLSAFLAFVLVLKPVGADRRLVFEGYGPLELIAAKVVVMLSVALIVTLYVTALLPLFFRPHRVGGVFLGFLLTALVYGALGLAVGAVVRRELEGILVILLLVNVDAGWLQSPVFYAHAHNQALIRLLPGHHPGQVAMLSAFTDSGVAGEVAGALVYVTVGIAVAATLYWFRVRVTR